MRELRVVTDKELSLIMAQANATRAIQLSLALLALSALTKAANEPVRMGKTRNAMVAVLTHKHLREGEREGKEREGESQKWLLVQNIVFPLSHHEGCV